MSADNQVKLGNGNSIEEPFIIKKHYVEVISDNNAAEIKTTNSAFKAFLYLAHAYLTKREGYEINFKIVTKAKVFEGTVLRGNRNWQKGQADPNVKVVLNQNAIGVMSEHKATPYSDSHKSDEQLPAVPPSITEHGVTDKASSIDSGQPVIDIQENDASHKEVKTSKWIDLDEWIKALNEGSENQPEQGIGSLTLVEGDEESKKKVADLLNEIKKIDTFPFLSYLNQNEKAKLKESLNKFNLEELEHLLVDISKVVIPTDSNFYIKLQHVIINCLSEIYPKIKESIKETLGSEGYLLILTPKGIQTIIDGLKDKIPENYNVGVSDTFEEFAGKLEEIKKIAVSEEEKLKYIFIVRHPESHHVTPIYLEKNSNGIQGVILDSSGNISPAYLKIFNFIEQKIPGIELYSYIEPRQRDVSSCPIFAIHDVVQIANTENFMEFVIHAAQEYDLNPSEPDWKGKKFFNDLPPSFMKPTQSLSMIDGYLEKHIARKEEKIGIQKKHTLSEAVTRHTRTVMVLRSGERVERNQNKFAERKFEKYSTKLILKTIIGAQTKET